MGSTYDAARFQVDGNAPRLRRVPYDVIYNISKITKHHQPRDDSEESSSTQKPIKLLFLSLCFGLNSDFMEIYR